jgi:hypothetical protein
MGSNSNDEDQSELDSINNNKKTCNSDDENEEQKALEQFLTSLHFFPLIWLDQSCHLF